jgi:uracil-DNA glycosylase family 4
MAEDFGMTSMEAARQLRQRLESLRAAGIDYLPLINEPLPIPAAPTTPQPSPHATLFDEPTAAPPDAPALSKEQRRVALDLLAKEVTGCVRCKELASTRTQTVFGVGPVEPDLCFVGEAPGHDEDLQGEPFVGPAGQLLNRIIAAAGMKRSEVFICNVLRCRPPGNPGNRPPTAEEAANCREHLEKTLELVHPRFICTLGLPAARALLELGPSVTMGRLRGRFYEYKGIPVVCTYHPSYLLRIPDEAKKNEEKRKVWEDVKMLLTQMGKPIPGKT